MFKRHAAFRIAGLKRPARWHAMLRGTVAAHANDNLRGLRRPSDRHRSAPPKLVCHWVVGDGNRLECRWQVEGHGVTIEDGPLIPHDDGSFGLRVEITAVS